MAALVSISSHKAHFTLICAHLFHWHTAFPETYSTLSVNTTTASWTLTSLAINDKVWQNVYHEYHKAVLLAIFTMNSNLKWNFAATILPYSVFRHTVKVFPVEFVCIFTHSCVLLYVYTKATFYVLCGCDFNYFVPFFSQLKVWEVHQCVPVNGWMTRFLNQSHMTRYRYDFYFFFKLA